MNDISLDSIFQEKEHEWKELLYTLFYEIKSEILGCKIEIEEEEYQENIRLISIPNLPTLFLISFFNKSSFNIL